MTNLKKQKAVFISPWTKWEPRTYLETYFVKPGPDSYTSLGFLIRELARHCKKPVSKILDFGCGPTIFGAAIAAPFTNEIHVSDYLESNLKEIRSWMKADKNAFDWNPYIGEILKIEGSTPTSQKINSRSRKIKKILKKIVKGDASKNKPLTINSSKYPVVLTIFCPDSATASKKEWQDFMKNICSLVDKNGLVLIASLRNCSHYKSGNLFYPCANVNEVDMKKVLKECGFNPKKTSIEVFRIPECKPEGFTSIMCASAIKN